MRSHTKAFVITIAILSLLLVTVIAGQYQTEVKYEELKKINESNVEVLTDTITQKDQALRSMTDQNEMLNDILKNR